MKRICLLLALLACLLFSACGNRENPAPEPLEDQEESISVVSDAPPVEPSQEPEASPDPEPSSSQEEQPLPQPPAQETPPANPPAPNPNPGNSQPASQASSGAYSMETALDSYSVGTDSIQVLITNGTNEEGGFGMQYQIQRLAGDAWETLPLEFDTMDIAAILPPGESQTMTVNLYPAQYDYTPGKYRVVKTDSGFNLSAEFHLE